MCPILMRIVEMFVFRARFQINITLLIICVQAMQTRVHAQIFILIYIDTANNFACRHFTSKAFF